MHQLRNGSRCGLVAVLILTATMRVQAGDDGVILVTAPNLSRLERINLAVRGRAEAVADVARQSSGRSSRMTGHGKLPSSVDAASAISLSDSSIAMSLDGTGQVSGGVCSEPAANCQAPNTSIIVSSDKTNFKAADNFTPLGNGSVTNVCWRGAYYDGVSDCQGVNPDVFEIRYYADTFGFPGALLATFLQSDGTLTVTRPVATGALAAGRVPEYAYSATHDPVAVAAGDCYWVEIVNPLATCTWFWESTIEGDGWAMQDGDGFVPPDGYSRNDSTPDDLAFCINLTLGDSTPCVPPPPVNDNCAESEPISGQGDFLFDNRTATTDGPAHDACLAFVERQLESDVWYTWTAPCTDQVFVATCGLTDMDSRIAVYDGDTCPPTDSMLLDCNDDICGDSLDPRQSLVMFDALLGQQYLIRIGNYPGERRGFGSFSISCGPPDNPTCPSQTDCCAQAGTPGCNVETCCEAVCACDPFCCEVFWDDSCAKQGFQATGCGAQALCGDLCGSSSCGGPAAGDCCSATGSPGCSDAACCEAVCALDEFCCTVEWDADCAGDGFDHNGNGAIVQCPELCGVCPVGTVTFIDPPDGVVDARQPYPPTFVLNRQGISTLTVSGPAGIDELGCWSLCESAVDGTPNTIAGVVDNLDGTFTVQLGRSIATGAVTTVTFTDGSGVPSIGTFISHPANVNADSSAGASDILAVIDALNASTSVPWGVYSSDVDHSGQSGASDILRVIDLLNGASAYDPWLGIPLPDCGTCCP